MLYLDLDFVFHIATCTEGISWSSRSWTSSRGTHRLPPSTPSTAISTVPAEGPGLSPRAQEHPHLGQGEELTPGCSWAVVGAAQQPSARGCSASKHTAATGGGDFHRPNTWTWVKGKDQKPESPWQHLSHCSFPLSQEHSPSWIFLDKSRWTYSSPPQFHLFNWDRTEVEKYLRSLKCLETQGEVAADLGPALRYRPTPRSHPCLQSPVYFGRADTPVPMALCLLTSCVSLRKRGVLLEAWLTSRPISVIF